MLQSNIPKIFWKYYDLYRRKMLSIDDFSSKTGLSVESLQIILLEILEK